MRTLFYKWRGESRLAECLSETLSADGLSVSAISTDNSEYTSTRYHFANSEGTYFGELIISRLVHSESQWPQQSTRDGWVLMDPSYSIQLNCGKDRLSSTFSLVGAAFPYDFPIETPISLNELSLNEVCEMPICRSTQTITHSPLSIPLIEVLDFGAWLHAKMSDYVFNPLFTDLCNLLEIATFNGVLLFDDTKDGAYWWSWSTTAATGLIEIDQSRGIHIAIPSMNECSCQHIPCVFPAVSMFQAYSFTAKRELAKFIAVTQIKPGFRIDYSMGETRSVHTLRLLNAPGTLPAFDTLSYFNALDPNRGSNHILYGNTWVIPQGGLSPTDPRFEGYNKDRAVVYLQRPPSLWQSPQYDNWAEDRLAQIYVDISVVESDYALYRVTDEALVPADKPGTTWRAYATKIAEKAKSYRVQIIDVSSGSPQPALTGLVGATGTRDFSVVNPSQGTLDVQTRENYYHPHNLPPGFYIEDSTEPQLFYLNSQNKPRWIFRIESPPIVIWEISGTRQDWMRYTFSVFSSRSNCVSNIRSTYSYDDWEGMNRVSGILDRNDNGILVYKVYVECTEDTNSSRDPRLPNITNAGKQYLGEHWGTMSTVTWTRAVLTAGTNYSSRIDLDYTWFPSGTPLTHTPYSMNQEPPFEIRSNWFEGTRLLSTTYRPTFTTGKYNGVTYLPGTPFTGNGAVFLSTPWLANRLYQVRTQRGDVFQVILEPSDDIAPPTTPSLERVVVVELSLELSMLHFTMLRIGLGSAKMNASGGSLGFISGTASVAQFVNGISDLITLVIVLEGGAVFTIPAKLLKLPLALWEQFGPQLKFRLHFPNAESPDIVIPAGSSYTSGG